MTGEESGRGVYRCSWCEETFQALTEECIGCPYCLRHDVFRAETDGGRAIHREGYEFELIPNGGRDADGEHRTLGRWTFEYTPARRIVEDHIHGRVLNACAGKTHLDHDGEVVRNDLNPVRDADLHVDVANIGRCFDMGSFDSVVFDPPFDSEQADDKYDGLRADDVNAAWEQFAGLVREGGTVVTFGWNSWGMGSFQMFERTHLYVLQRGPCLRDVFVTVDERVGQQSLGEVFAHD